MTGETISSYRIVEKLGEGGMGVVYKAWDLRLDRPVALKFIAADLLPSADAQARFRHEARALARLNHPNIAGIYGVDEACGRLFLVLEYLPGGTLRQFVKAVAAGHSKISPATVRAFALQVAEGLAHAHRHGIYHRDVKTDNAMLAAEGAVKVTDFGLAKIRGGMELTGGGRRLGTPAYMSPEQIEGRPVDQRSDIFSFGVLLYELASGERPFRGDSEEELVQAILHQPHRPLRETRSDLPPGIETVVNRALEKRPEQRWASMDEVVAELSGSGRFLAAGKTTATFGGALQRPRSRRKWFALALCLLVVALAAAGAWIWRSGGTGVEKGASVLLADIENQTGDAQLDAVTEILRAQVAQSVHFNLLGRAEVRDLLERMVRKADQPLDGEIARELAWRAGAPLVIAGTVSQLGDRYALTVRLERLSGQPVPETVLYQTYEARNKSELLTKLGPASSWLRRKAGEAAGDIERLNEPPEHTTTDSWQALDLFTRAERLRRQDRLEDAIVLYREAAQADPHFALAYLRLGDVIAEMDRFTEAVRWYRRAVAELKTRRLSKREELRIRILYGIDSGDLAAADSALHAYALLYPADSYAPFFRATTLEKQARTEEAIEQWLEAERMAPGRYEIQVHLAMAYIFNNRFADAAAQIRKVREMGHSDWARFLEGTSSFLQGSPEEAARAYADLGDSRSKVWQSRSYALRACVQAETGDRAGSAALLQEGVLRDRKEKSAAGESNKHVALGYLLYRDGDLAAAREHCRRAMALDTSPHRAVLAGAVLARAGYPSEAEALLPAVEGPERVFEAARLRITGEALAARGRLPEAIAAFRKADTLEPPSGPREYLARALARSGDRRGALDLYQRIIDLHNLIWVSPEQEFPGLLAEALFQTAVLADSLGAREQARAAAARLVGLAAARVHTAEVEAARRILDRAEQ